MDTDDDIVSLAPHHDRATFACGEPSLDNYIRRQASQDVKRDLAACYVLCKPGESRIMGYNTLSATSVSLTSLPDDLLKKAGRYPLVPAVLLGRLAVDQTYRKQGWGEYLLLDALHRILQTGVGVKFVLVDALDEQAAQFYERFEFQRLKNPSSLYLSVSAIRDIFPDE